MRVEGAHLHLRMIQGRTGGRWSGKSEGGKADPACCKGIYLGSCSPVSPTHAEQISQNIIDICSKIESSGVGSYQTLLRLSPQDITNCSNYDNLPPGTWWQSKLLAKMSPRL